MLDPSRHFPMPQAYSGMPQSTAGSLPPYNDGTGVFPQYYYPPHNQHGAYGDLKPPPITPPNQPYQTQTYPINHETSGNSALVENEQSTAENLSEVLGELRIEESGIGMNWPACILDDC